jgi:hypothetical protein
MLALNLFYGHWPGAVQRASAAVFVCTHDVRTYLPLLLMRLPPLPPLLPLLMMLMLLPPLCLQVMTDNPLADFVELPEEYRPLCYSNLLPGVIRGALEMVRILFEGSTGKQSGCLYA